MTNPGNYHSAALELKHSISAKAVVLIVANGDKGSGCETVGDAESLALIAKTLPKLMKSMLKDISSDAENN